MRKRFLTLFVFFVFLFGVWGFQVQTTDATQASHQGLSKELSQKIEQQVLDEISSKGKTTFWVMLKEKAELSSAFNIKKDRERGDFVYQTLRSVADQSQAGLRAFLATTGVKYFPFWIANTIQVRDAGSVLLKEIAARPDVDKIVADRVYQLPKPLPGIQESTPGTTEWNIDNIQAPQVWSTFNDRGEGIVVANVDTGFQFNHSALVAKYRGNLGGGNFDHNYNWFDPSNICGGAPCDNVGHGSHTMGTMVGDDGDPGTNQIGVAPHAQFMGCKGCETNSCSDFALNTCGQFILAPTDLNGNNPDSSKRPHIVNNSWGGGPGDPFYQPVVDAWEASGIFPQFSAGNSGPGCNTVGSPGDYINSYAAAAYDINNIIAGFSSRGPGAFGGEIKPNIAAPGVNVRSSVPTNSYALFSGTSMASPHVAGVVALMWSAAPSLVRDIAATRAILDSIAIDVNDTSCGGTAADNNVWGEGRIDALEAVTQSPICDLGTISGTVTDSGTSQPIAGAHVDADGAVDKSTTTDANGNYSMDLCEGSYDVTASAFTYLPETVTVNITAGNTTTQDFQLDQAPLATVTGTVTDGSGHGWPLYARIDIDAFPGSPIFTNPADGTYSVDLPEGTIFTFHVNAVSPGYNEEQRDVDPGANPTEDFALTVDSGCTAPGYGVDSFITNGGFETGDFTGWVIDGTSNSPFVTGAEHHSGAFSAQAGDATGPEPFGDSSFYQQITVPGGGGGLTFWTKKFTTDSISFDWQDAYITDTSGNILQTIFHVCETSGWTHWSVDLAPYAGQTIRLKFLVHQDAFGDDTAMWVDDVSAGPCDPIPGGLLVGNVYDSNTGQGLNGATVTSDENPSDHANTVATPNDSNVDDGFYTLFSTLTGSHDFTASKNQYGSDTENVDVQADDVVVQNFELGTGHLVASPSELEDIVDLGDTDTQQLTITNDGNADGTFEIQEGNGLVSFKIKGPNLPKAKAHKVDRKVKAKSGPTSVMAMKSAPESKLKGLFPSKGPKRPNGGGWTPGSPIPFGIIRYGHAQCDETPDSFYIISGVDVNFGLSSAVARYDADTDTWTSLASYPNASEAPSAVCFQGRIYVANGAGTSNDFFIYDIATDSWLAGATLPRFVEGAAMGALDGKVYMIGGDDDFFPGDGISNEVDIYDIATDTWTGTGSPMPDGVSNAGSAQAGPFVYVAGGWDVNSPASNSNFTQRYDMSSDTWEVGPSFDVAVSDHALSATDTALYVMGGDANGNGFFEATDTAQRLDVSGWPGGAWADLGTPLPSARSANTAGFCTTAVTGGEVWTDGGFFNFNPPISDNLYHNTGEGCAGGGIDVPWISENPATATVPAGGGSVVVDVTYDAGQVNQPGDYFAHLTIKTDTPYPAQKVNVTMHVPLPANFGTLNGTVTGLQQCDAPGGPIEGATVFIDGQNEDFTLTTDANGFYTWALDAANSPVTITVSADGYNGESQSGVIITPQQTTTTDFELRLDAACLSVNPTELEDIVPFGGQDTQQFTITNDGASDANFELTEGNGLSFKFRHPKLPKAQANKHNAKAKTGPTSIMSMKDAPKEKLKALFPDKGPNGSGWTSTSNMPNPVIRFAHAQCDDTPESFYVISGVDSGFGLANSMQRYDADTDTWTSLASYPNPAEAPTAVCFEGRIYVANGAFTSNDFFIYDIATDSWLQGAALPRFVEGAAMGALDGKIYLIGGDDDFQPADGISNEVDIYDIATDSWTGTGTPMPEGVSNAGMVQSGQFVYVVGGWNSSSPGVNSTMTQRYDMSGDTWEVGPTFDLGNADFALAASDTALYQAGGDAFGGGFFDPSNAAQRLDVSGWPSGAWADLGDPLPEARLANNAGFCTTAVTGGEVWSAGGLNSSFIVDGKNQYHTTGEGCAGAADVPWLSENPFEGTIPADGGQAVIDVNYDAAQVLQPGDFFAHINVKGNAPGATPKVNVTMHVPVPPNFGLLDGTVTGLGQCDAAGGPISGATVFIDGPNADYTLETDASGHYQWYFDAANSPVDVTVSAPGYIGMTQTGVVMNAGQTTTVDFSLRLDAPCLSVDPTSIDQTVPLGGQVTQQITISNTGAGDADYKIRESGGAALKLPNLPKAKTHKVDPKVLAKSGPTSVMSMRNAPKSKLNGLFPGNTPTGGGWIPGSPIPFGIIRYGHAQCDETPESFYIISGVDSGFGLSSAVARYDADTDTWTSLASYPNPAEAPSAVCFEGRIYVANGAFTSNEFFIYDIATDTWLTGAALPRFVEGAAMGALDGKVYMIGGDDDFSPPTSNEVNIYDIATDTSTGTGTAMPDGVSQGGSAQAGTFVYIAGGWGASAPGANSTFTQRYDMSSDTWEVEPTFDLAVADVALSATDTALYSMGGDQNGNGFFEATDAVQRLDLSSWPGGSWADLGDPLPSPRQANTAGFCTTAFTGGEVWTDGGFFNFNTPLSDNLYRNTGEGCASGGGDVPWLSENPSEGTVPAGGSVVVDVTLDASQVAAEGDYFAQLKISGNAPGASPTVDVAMHVIDNCTYSNDFNDATREWIEEKPAVTQPGDGFLHFDPVKRKAVGVADSSFAGASSGTFTYVIQFTGGIFSRNWIYTHRIDKKNQMEVLFREGSDRVVVKQRGPGGIIKKAKAIFTLDPNTIYTVAIVYNGTTYDVTINGTAVITGFSPAGALPSANIGAAAKNDSMLVDNVCVQ